MKTTDLQEIRRRNLKEWFSERPIPKKEKSYISQLINGKTSFGERAGRRLEQSYSMPKFYLDQINHPIDVGNVDFNSNIITVHGNANQISDIVQNAPVVNVGLVASSRIKKKKMPDSSMGVERIIPEGSMMEIDYSDTIIQNGSTYLIELDNTEFVRQIHILGEGKILLKAHNPSYPSLTVGRDQIKIIGRVVGWYVGD